MKVAVSIGNYELVNSLIKVGEELGIEVVFAKVEKTLMEQLEKNDIDACVVSGEMDYAQNAVNFTKKHYPYKPVIIVGTGDFYNIKNADIFFPFSTEIDKELYSKSILFSVKSYIKNLETLKRLMESFPDVIEFSDYKYDPASKGFYYKDTLVKKLSPKQGGILEVLSVNYGKIVKRDMILEKLWPESNYFTSRSLDVFVSHLRSIFKENNIPLVITNIPDVGMIMKNTI